MKFTLEIELAGETGDSVADLLDEVSAQVNVDTPFTVGEHGFLFAEDESTVIGKWEVVLSKGDPHPHVGVGYCRICDHYGDDCTGTHSVVDTLDPKFRREALRLLANAGAA